MTEILQKIKNGINLEDYCVFYIKIKRAKLLSTKI